MLQDLGWKSLEDRRLDIRLALVFKAVHGLAAVPTTDTLIKANKRTRSNQPYMFCHIPADSTAYHQSFFPRTVPQWNNLPLEAVTLPESLLQAVSDQSTRSDYPPRPWLGGAPPSVRYPVWEFAEYMTRQDKTNRGCVFIDNETHSSGVN